MELDRAFDRLARQQHHLAGSDPESVGREEERKTQEHSADTPKQTCRGAFIFFSDGQPCRSDLQSG